MHIVLVFKLKCSYIIDYIFRFRNGSTSGNHCIHLNNFSSSSSSHNSYCSSRISIHTILPHWMLEKPELVCPPDSKQKGELIGSGQYGMVYKGSYNHGTARFVYDIFSCHYFKIWKQNQNFLFDFKELCTRILFVLGWICNDYIWKSAMTWIFYNIWIRPTIWIEMDGSLRQSDPPPFF